MLAGLNATEAVTKSAEEPSMKTPAPDLAGPTQENNAMAFS